MILSVEGVREGLLQYDLSYAVQKLLQNTPIIDRDFTTLDTVIDLLVLVVSGDAASDGMEKLVEDIFDSVNGPLLPLLDGSFKREQLHYDKRHRCPSRELVLKTRASVVHLLLCASQRYLGSDRAESGPVAQTGAASIFSRDLLYAVVRLSVIESDAESSSLIRRDCFKCLELLASSEDGRELLRQPLATLQLISSATKKSSVAADIHYGLNPTNSVLEEVCGCCRVLRSPDSYRGSALIVGSIRLLLAATIDTSEQSACKSICLNNYDSTLSNTSGKSGMTSLYKSSRYWAWLLRLCFDRRGDIRALSLMLLGRVCECVEFEDINDSVRPPSEDSASADEVVAEVGKDTTDTKISVQRWPPVESLLVLGADTFESGAVRGTALLIVARLLRQSYNEDDISLDVTESIAHVSEEQRMQTLGSVASYLSRALRVCPECTSIAVRALKSLMTFNASNKYITDEQKRSDYAVWTRLKLLPMLVDVIKPNGESILLESALARVGLSCPDTCIVKDISLGGENQGWNILWNNFANKQSQKLQYAQMNASRLLLTLLNNSSSSKNNNTSLDMLAFDVVRRSSLVRNLVIHLTKNYVFTSNSGMYAEAMAFNSNVELLCHILEDGGLLVKPVNGSTDVVGLLPQQSVVPFSVLAAVTGRLEAARSILGATVGRMTHHNSVAGVTMSRCLRLVIAILQDDQWRRNLGLISGSSKSGGDNGLVTSQPCQAVTRLYTVLSSLIREVRDWSNIFVSPVMVEMALTLLLQHGGYQLATQTATEAEEKEKAAFAHYVTSTAIDELTSRIKEWKDTVVADKAKGQSKVLTVAKASLRTLKGRTCSSSESRRGVRSVAEASKPTAALSSKSAETFPRQPKRKSNIALLTDKRSYTSSLTGSVQQMAIGSNIADPKNVVGLLYLLNALATQTDVLSLCWSTGLVNLLGDLLHRHASVMYSASVENSAFGSQHVVVCVLGLVASLSKPSPRLGLLAGSMRHEVSGRLTAQLTALGLRSAVTSIRGICLSVAGALTATREASGGANARPAAVILGRELMTVLDAHTSSRGTIQSSFVLACLVDALAVTAADYLEDQLADITQQATLPEIFESLCTDDASPSIWTGVCRCLGLLVMRGGSAKSTTSRRITTLVADVRCLRILLEGVVSSHPVLSKAAMVALWASVHKSEQVRAEVKRLLAAGVISRDMFDDMLLSRESDCDGDRRVKDALRRHIT